VLEDGKLVGICTRTDILRARERQLELERAQPGWRRNHRTGPVPVRVRRAPDDADERGAESL
jgi:CBS domain-containing protein